MRLKRTVAATESPITLSAIRSHLRLDDDDTTHDERIIDISVHATAAAQDFLNRALLTETYEYRLDRFPPYKIELPLAPVQSVTSVQYVDNDGNTQTWNSSNWRLDNYDDSGRACVRPVYGEVFPTPRVDYNSVIVTFVTGWSDSSLIPEAVIRAILLLCGDMFENTEASAPVELREIPLGVRHLLTPHRNFRF